jgi:hypothetical protein
MTAEITIFDNVHGDIKSLPSDMQASVIKELAQQVHDNPKLSNKFITFLQTNLDPVMAVYGYYYSIDEGLLQPTARNFQTTMLFEQEFNHLIKYLTPSKKATLYESVADGIGLTQIELELTSPFELQPEDEIGTGTWEYVEPELPEIDDDDTANPATTTITSTPGTIKIPFKDILDKAAKKVFGVGVKKTAADDEDRDAYHVYTHYYFTSIISATPKFEVVSAKYWDEKEELDDQPISEYLEHIILDWGTHWHEREPSIIEYTGPGTLEDATELLRETGFFKPCKLHDNTPADLILSMLDEAPAEVVLDILKIALDKLSPEDVTEIASELTNILQE